MPCFVILKLKMAGQFASSCLCETTQPIMSSLFAFNETILLKMQYLFQFNQVCYAVIVVCFNHCLVTGSVRFKYQYFASKLFRYSSAPTPKVSISKFVSFQNISCLKKPYQTRNHKITKLCQSLFLVKKCFYIVQLILYSTIF